MRRATRIRASPPAGVSATWPAAKWPWFGELAGRGYLVTAVHHGKNPLVTGEVARLLGPICRTEIERMRAAARGWADRGPAQLTGPDGTAALIDQLRADGTVLTYDPDRRTLRAAGHDTPSVTIGTDPAGTHARRDRERRTA
jgi:hypothetical protein